MGYVYAKIINKIKTINSMKNRFNALNRIKTINMTFFACLYPAAAFSI